MVSVEQKLRVNQQKHDKWELWAWTPVNMKNIYEVHYFTYQQFGL